MSRMQYGEFVFPHNPRRIELSYTGTLAPQVFPGCGAAVQELGPRCRVARCEGEVFAPTPEGAAAKLAEISAACTGGGFALLYLPAGAALRPPSPASPTRRRGTGGCLPTRSNSSSAPHREGWAHDRADRRMVLHGEGFGG